MVPAPDFLLAVPVPRRMLEATFVNLKLRKLI
jgi:hypothetical protein